MLRAGFVAAVAYRGEFFVWMLTTNMPLVMMLLWRRVAQDAPVGRFTATRFTAYFMVTLIVRLLTGSWVVWQITWDIREGSLGPRLLRPVHPFVSYAAENLAVVPLRLLVAIPLGLGFVLTSGTSGLSHDPVQLLLVVPAVMGAWLLAYNAQLVVSALALFVESAMTVWDLWMALGFVLSGYILPLELLPHRLAVISRWTPLRYTLATPVEAALGLQSRADTLREIGLQWAWALAFLLFARWLWRRGLKRFSAHGG